MTLGLFFLVSTAPTEPVLVVHRKIYVAFGEFRPRREQQSFQRAVLWGTFGVPWESLGGPLAPMGVPWGSLGGPLGSLGGPLGVPWGPLGVPWGSLGVPWGSSGNPLGVLLELGLIFYDLLIILGRILGSKMRFLGSVFENSENIRFSKYRTACRREARFGGAGVICTAPVDPISFSSLLSRREAHFFISEFG